MDIHYRRAHAGVTTYRQLVLDASEDVVVTFQAETPLLRPLLVEGKTILEPGSPVIWFTYPTAWHDVGKFYLPDGRFVGYYANVLTPVESAGPDAWSTTDLYLDVWLPRSGRPRILDEEELDSAVHAGDMAPETADRARQEAAALLEAARSGTWPPAFVVGWELERAKAVAALAAAEE